MQPMAGFGTGARSLYWAVPARRGASSLRQFPEAIRRPGLPDDQPVVSCDCDEDSDAANSGTVIVVSKICRDSSKVLTMLP